MCLITEQKKPKKTRTEQVYYKVALVDKLNVSISQESMTFYFSPYKTYPIFIGRNERIPDDQPWEVETYYKDRASSIKWEVHEEFNDMRLVEGGGFHLFISRKDAENEAEYLNSVYSLHFRVIKAVVPKGTEYYKGHYYHGLMTLPETLKKKPDNICVREVRYEEI